MSYKPVQESLVHLFTLVSNWTCHDDLQTKYSGPTMVKCIDIATIASIIGPFLQLAEQ
jgi:hypothetical protein